MTSIENVRLDKMEDKLDEVAHKVDRVLSALEGDNLNVDGGLVQQMKDLKDRLAILENIKNKIIWGSVGTGIAGGWGIKAVIEWIQAAAVVK